MDRAKKVTIYDVATLAGVSKGTVDRVIYNRGRVSPETAARVQEAIDKSGYNPNLHASVLASRKQHVLACLLPEFTPKQYWEKIYNGFLMGVESVSTYNIVPEVRFYDQYDEHSFVNAFNEILALNPSGVLFHPFFPSASAAFSSILHEKGIPYGYVDGKIPDGNYVVYYGADLYNSGYFGAYLLTNRQDVDEVLIVRIKRDGEYKSDPTYERRKGFISFIKEHYPDCRIHVLFVNPNDQDEINIALGDFFREHPEVRHIIMLNSRVHLIADYLKRNPVKGRIVAGFDDIKDNIEALREGDVDVLVTRHIPQQSYNVVVKLVDYIIQGKRPEKRDNYMHIDVLTKYNLDNY